MLADRYTWQATRPDGSVFTTGGDLSDAVLVSFVPAPGTALPRHDFAGQRFVRRFIRQFKRATVGGFDRARYFAEHERNLSDERKASRAARDAAGRKPKPPPPLKNENKPRPLDEAFHVLETEFCRIYIRCWNGETKMTPRDYELYL